MGVSLDIKYTAKDGNEVVLTADIVRETLAKGKAQVTPKDIYLYEKFCESKKLNPFVGDAYLIKYFPDKDADIITSKSFLLKTLKSLPGYNWHQAGIIVASLKDDMPVIKKLDGTFYLKEYEQLVGGWASICINNHVFDHSVNLDEFNKDKKTWNQIPAVMIRKVALAQACEEVSPADFGNMYLEEELVMSGALQEKNNIKVLREQIAAVGNQLHKETANSLTDEDALQALYDSIKGVADDTKPVELES